jgi:hypothetical protein
MYIYIPIEILQMLGFPKECFSSLTVYKYFVGYVWCMLTVYGRKTSRNIHGHCFFFRKNVSGWCRFLNEYKWDYTKVIEKMYHWLMKEFGNKAIVHGAVQACYDTTLIAKSSKKVIGVQKWNNHSGNPDAGEFLVGHHWGVLGIIVGIKTRYIALLISFRLITGKLSNCQWKCTPNGEVTPLKIWDVSHAQLFQLKEWTKNRNLELRVVEDAYFANKPNIQPLIDKGIDVVTRLRVDGVGHFDAEPRKEKARGRPPKYGKKVKVADIWDMHEHQSITVQVYGKEQTMEVAVGELWVLELSKKARVVVFKGSKGKLISLMCTDLSLNASQIIEIYGARFSIEIAIRDIKQHLGFEDYQHHSLLPVLRFLHIVGVAYNIGKTALIKHSDSEWLNIDSEGGHTPWTSELSFSKLRYCLRRFALGKLVLGDSAKHAELNKKDLDRDAIMQMAC